MAPDSSDHDDPVTTVVDSTAARGPEVAATGLAPATPSARLASVATLPPSRRYELGAALGTGGMGEVLSARDTHLGREVAVKRLRAAEPSEDELGRFLREARIQGQLEHPAIVPIHDLAVDDAGRPFFAMKQLAGVTLHDILHRPLDRNSVISTWTRARLLRAFVEVSLAIEFAHTRGVIHRDLKPGNIVLGDFGEVYVIDWGVARVLGEGPEPMIAARARPSAHDLGLSPTTPVPSAAVTIDAGATAAGAILGTPGYMSPEQIRADPALGPAADVYALGCILFEILAGEALHPRGVAALSTTITGIDARPSLRAPSKGISPELDAICVRATAIDPDARFISARALADAVQGFLDGDRDLALRRDLAKQHLAEIRGTLSRGNDPDNRRRIMRAASAALALDPGAVEASELISRLLLEAPAQTPPEVRAELLRTDAAHARRHARFGALTFLAYISFIPGFLWVGVRDWTYLAIGYGLVTLNLVWSQYTTRMESPPPYRAWVTASIQGLIVAVFGRMLGPWLVAPGLAAISLAILATHPHLRATWLLTMMFGVATLAPWGLELLHILPRSYLNGPEGFTLMPVALVFDGVRGQYLILGWVVGVLLVAGVLARRIARSHADIERRYATQAWQLRQLVPEITSGAANATG